VTQAWYKGLQARNILEFSKKSARKDKGPKRPHSGLTDWEYERAVQNQTGGKSGYIQGRQFDSITDDALIQAKNNPSASRKPINFLSKSRRKQIQRSIEIASDLGKKAEFWFPIEPHRDVINYILDRGGIVVVWSP
jgi:hypothetical protein